MTSITARIAQKAQSLRKRLGPKNKRKKSLGEILKSSPDVTSSDDVRRIQNYFKAQLENGMRGPDPQRQREMGVRRARAASAKRHNAHEQADNLAPHLISQSILSPLDDVSPHKPPPLQKQFATKKNSLGKLMTKTLPPIWSGGKTRKRRRKRRRKTKRKGRRKTKKRRKRRKRKTRRKR
jgi:hypothetical protein